MLLDIRPDHLHLVQEILRNHVPDHDVWAFGSRAKWTARDTSDLDLCIVDNAPLGFKLLGQLRDAFSESNLPYKVDVVDWATTSDAFRKIIEQDKVVVQKPIVCGVRSRVTRQTADEAKDDDGLRDKAANPTCVGLGLAGEWTTIRLGDVCVKIGSGATPRGGKEAYKGGETSLIRSQNIYNDGFHRDGLVYIDDKQSAELRNVEVKANDVLLNITGDSVARCCQVIEDICPPASISMSRLFVRIPIRLMLAFYVTSWFPRNAKDDCWLLHLLVRRGMH